MVLCFSPSWRALMRRNAIYGRRHWISTTLQIVLPLCFMALLVLIRRKASELVDSDEETVYPADIPDDSRVFYPPSFSDYLRAVEIPKTCVSRYNRWDISGMDGSSSLWGIPTIMSCDAQLCQYDGQDASDFCQYNAIMVAGHESAGQERARDFMIWLESTYPSVSSISIPIPNTTEHTALFQMVSSSRDMDRIVRGVNQNDDLSYQSSLSYMIGIVFEENNDDNIYSYSLRPNATLQQDTTNIYRGRKPLTIPNTNQLFVSTAKDDHQCAGYTKFGSFGPLSTSSCTLRYAKNGVLTMQRLVHDYIFNRTAGVIDKDAFVGETAVRYVPFPQESYVVEEEGWYSTFTNFFVVFLVLGLLYPVASIVAYITQEKELRQKELMKMMSVTEFDIGSSWFCSFLLLHTATATVLTIQAKNFFDNQVDVEILWFFWMTTMLSITTFSLFIATWTSKATRGALFALLTFFVGLFLPFTVNSEEDSKFSTAMVSVHPVAGLYYGVREISRLVDSKAGLSFETMRNGGTDENKSGYTFQDTLSNMVVSSILLGIITWILNRSVQPDYGQQVYSLWFCRAKEGNGWSSLFPFSQTVGRVFYQTVAMESRISNGRTNAFHYDEDEEGTANGSNPNDDVPVEPVGEDLKRQEEAGVGIQIKRLYKVFGTSKVAVDDLSLSMYSGHVTALLGPNGAGKTTTIGMLTGTLAPSAGSAKIMGYDLQKHTTQIRKRIGICLQHDCLFPDLTVRQHLQFFSRIKGLYRSLPSHREAEQQISKLMEDVDLADKKNILSKNLSGGMKRKLSVAMAFCGNSPIVLLDEPTSGMDPFSRRYTWDLIRRYKHDRCIILTTHFMDEADILGDRIAIMAEGRLRCVGSSLFLKKTYGVGYQLTIERSGSSQRPHGADRKGLATDQGDGNIHQIVTGAVEEANLLTSAANEVSYQLPMTAASKFPPMFESLDTEMDRGNIMSYGVGITTLDEVFILVARGGRAGGGTDSDSGRKPNSNLPQNPMLPRRSWMDLEKEGLFFLHVGSLLKKRALSFSRDKKAWFCTTILPSLFVFLGFLLLSLPTESTPKFDPLPLDLNHYNRHIDESLARNPIMVNSPSSFFQCQPGNCASRPTQVDEPITNEPYFYCGHQARIGVESQCSIEDSFSIGSRITEAGAHAFVGKAESVYESSIRLLNTSKSFRASQYGAIFFTNEPTSQLRGSLSTYADIVMETCSENENTYNSIDECKRFGGYGYVIQYNFTAIHVAPLLQTLADKALIRYISNKEQFDIRCTIAPLPIKREEEDVTEVDNRFFSWFLVVLSFPFIAGSFGTFVVNERESKAKHLQTVAGVQPPAYWLSTWLWDVVNYQLPMWMTVMLMFVFDVDELTTRENDIRQGVISLLLFYGPASAGFTYCISYAFTSASMCNLFVIITSFFVGVTGPIINLVLFQYFTHLGKRISWVCRLFPAYNLGVGLYNAVFLDEIDEGSAGLSAWSKEVMLREVICLAVESILYPVVAVLIDVWHPQLASLGHAVSPGSVIGNQQGSGDCHDEDVRAQTDRVISGEAENDLVVLKELTKVYPNGKLAVNKLSLGIPPGEIFALLGVNGAGKTTTMQMLTAEFPPTSGDANLAGYSVYHEPIKTRRRIGYCPQFDALFPNLTGREHVGLYASIKGVPKQFVKNAVDEKLQEVGLNGSVGDRLAERYSGGMKRRLSLACALIGRPQIVILDECTTGVDAVARREIWQVVSNIVEPVPDMLEEERACVIFTTHSMDECEALSTRIGIMANGSLRCLGSAQRLKNKFGKGYQIELRVRVVAPEDADYSDAAEKISASRTGAEATEAMSLAEITQVLHCLSGDGLLADMIRPTNQQGRMIWRDAVSEGGATVQSVAGFAALELRIQKLTHFMINAFPERSYFRERQENKVRFEVSSETDNNGKGIRISQIFAKIEAAKDELRLAEYSVSQTSLEQVFNSHAEAAATATSSAPRTEMQPYPDPDVETAIPSTPETEMQSFPNVSTATPSALESEMQSFRVPDASSTHPRIV